MVDAGLALRDAFWEALAYRLGWSVSRVRSTYPLRIEQVLAHAALEDASVDLASSSNERGRVFQLAGPRAATADLGLLDQAKKGQDLGIDARATRDATGWFLGLDQRWRFEIDDSKSFAKGSGTFGEVCMKWYRLGVERTGDQCYVTTLSDVLFHFELYRAYPQIGSIEVQMMPPGLRASARLVLEPGKRAVMQIDEHLPSDKWVSCAIHEIQHLIQEIEGFAIGGTAEAFVDKDLTQDVVRPIDHAIDALLRNDADFGSLVRQKNRMFIALSDKYGYNRERAGKSERCLSWEQVPQDEAQAYFGLLDRLEGYEQSGELFDLEQQRRSVLRDGVLLSAAQQYRRLAGEVEARATQARRALSAEQRAQRPVEDDYDVALGDVDVRFRARNAPRAVFDDLPVAMVRGSLDAPLWLTASGFGVEGALMRLYEEADPSTLAHELGHYFLEVYASVALGIVQRMQEGETTTRAEREIVIDLAQVLSWLGVESRDEVGPGLELGQGAIVAWAKTSLSQRRVHHERFARAFEAYVGEGRAPASRLDRVFSYFSKWIDRAYRLLLDREVQVPCAVKEVMARMLSEPESDGDTQSVPLCRPAPI